MIIDSHCHTHFNNNSNADDVVNGILHDMHITGVDKACLIPFNTSGYLYANREDILRSAELLCDISVKYSSKFYSMLWVNPALPADFTVSTVKEYVLNGPINGVKLWVELNARDKRLDPLMEFLQDNGIPLIYHCWYKTTEKCTYESDPSDIACLVKKFPDLKICMAHLTGCRLKGIQDIKQYTNVVIDTSGSQPEDGYLEYALKELGAGRILFGSDYPLRDLAVQLGRIESLDMKTEDREKILYRNALKFFKGDKQDV